MNMVSEELKGMADSWMSTDNVWLREVFFSKLKTKLLNVEFVINSAEGMFKDWRETTQQLDDEAKNEISCDQQRSLGPGPPNQKCTYKQQVG